MATKKKPVRRPKKAARVKAARTKPLAVSETVKG
jgi:hypothetical protein